jgi:hypothetical protein
MDNKNPALVQEPRYEPAIVIPLKQEASLIDWLKANNRLIAREASELEKVKAEDDLDVLMDTDDDDDDDFIDDADDDD